MLEPEQVEEEVVESIPGSEVKYLCISPLVLSESTAPQESKAFVSPESGTFSDLLYDSTMTRMEESGLYTPDQIASFYKFQVMPDLFYLEKLAAQKKKFARIYSLASASGMREVRGYTFPFTLYAAPEVHRFLFSNGFGAYTQHGFGMLDYSQPVPVSRQLLLGETSKA
jgi:CRISPR-associated endoribonuclease Cas6